MLWAFQGFLFVSYWIMLIFGFVGYVAVGAVTVAFVVDESTVLSDDDQPSRTPDLYKPVVYVIGILCGLIWWISLPIMIGWHAVKKRQRS